MAIPSSQNTQNCQLCIANIETISLKRLEMFGGWLSILSILTRGYGSELTICLGVPHVGLLA